MSLLSNDEYEFDDSMHVSILDLAMKDDILVDLVTNRLESLRVERDRTACVGAAKEAILEGDERYSGRHVVVVSSGAVGLVAVGFGKL